MRTRPSISPVFSRGLSAAVCLLAVVAAPALAQDINTARATFAHEVIALAARGDSAALATVLAPRFAADEGARLADAAGMLARLGEQAKGLDIEKIDAMDGNTMVTVRAAGWPRLALVNLGWDGTDAAKLRSVELLKAWDPAADKVAWTPARSTAEMLQRLDRNIGALVRVGFYSGTVLVARGDSVLFARGYGWANLDDSVRNSVQIS